MAQGLATAGARATELNKALDEEQFTLKKARPFKPQSKVNL